MGPVAALACLFLLIVTSPAVASPATSGALAGRVVEADHPDRPVAFCSVVVAGTGRGALTDESGHFLIPDLPPGRYTIRVRLIGYDAPTRTVEVRRGKTTRVEVSLTSLLGPNVGDIGPAFPDAATRRRLAKARQVEVFHIENSSRHRGDSLFHAQPQWSTTHTLLAREDHPARGWLKRLRELLDSPQSHRAYPPGVVKLCGGFDPGVVVRFADAGGVSDVLLCFKCEDLKVISDGRSGPIVDFSPLAREYVDLAREVFPGDAALAELSRRKAEEEARRRPGKDQ